MFYFFGHADSENSLNKLVCIKCNRIYVTDFKLNIQKFFLKNKFQKYPRENDIVMRNYRGCLWQARKVTLQLFNAKKMAKFHGQLCKSNKFTSGSSVLLITMVRNDWSTLKWLDHAYLASRNFPVNNQPLIKVLVDFLDLNLVFN